MLAGQIHAPRQIRLIDVPEPKLVLDADDGQGQIIFQPELGCLCGSDVLFFEADNPEFQPVVGHSMHEMIGRVVDTSGTRFRPGERVLCVPAFQKGLFERFRVSEAQAIPLDPRPVEEHALLAQPLGTVVFALKKVPNLIDVDVVVVGQGPIGQLFCAALRNVGARHIIAIDPIQRRLKTSPAMGANAIIDPQREDPIEKVKQITDGAMADLVIEAVGHRDHALHRCVDLCRHGGRILLFGIMPRKTNADGWRHLQSKNITLHTSVGPDFVRDFPLAMRWIAEGRIDVSPIITHRFALSEIQTAFDTFCERKEGALKVFVEFPNR